MEKEKISQAIEQYLKENNLFLVDITISKDNDIEIVIESYNADVKIGNCIDIDRIVADNFSRDTEDYSLTVTSAGLDQPFIVLDQYKKFIGSEVEVTAKNGSKTKGVLSDVTENDFSITISKMVKVEGSKKKVQQDTILKYEYSNIKSCKPVIKFK